ncbi:MAG TPA: hypothetical protein VIA09_07120 [Nitrososphaeraceae archaeon]|jgi:hypothetical protein
MGETFDRIKKAFRDTGEKTSDSVEKITDPDTYTGSNNVNENRDYDKSGKEPMNPKDIAEHEPTAVKRDKNQGDTGDPV